MTVDHGDPGNNNEEFFLADEDLADLDPELQEEMRATLRRISSAMDAGREPSEEDMEHLGRLIEQLPAEQLSPEDQCMSDTLEDLRREGLRKCARLLTEFLSSLPPELASLSYVDTLPALEPHLQEDFSQGEDVKAMGDKGLKLASRGITPSTLYETLRLLKSFPKRIISHQPHLPPHEQLRILDDGSYLFPWALLQAQVRCGMASQSPQDSIEPTYQWMMEVLKQQPGLCDGYQAIYVPEGIAFRLDDQWWKSHLGNE